MLSLEAAARPAAISTAYLHKLEAGRVGNPSRRVLERVAVVLGEIVRLLGELRNELAKLREALERLTLSSR